MHSITYRITGLMFLLVAITVAGLTYLANWQMENLFQDYLQTMQIGIQEGGRMMVGVIGLPEKEFLASVHEALIWVGTGILIFGLFVSHALARSITVPLLKLNSAVEKIARGEFGQKVDINAKDEVGKLAAAFNQMAEILVANNQLRQRLLADIAHELKTPLAVIQGNLEGMLDGVIEPDKEQLQSLYEETIQLNILIKDLRDLSLAEAGQLRLEKQPTDVNQIIVRASGMLKPLADEKDINLVNELGELPNISVDAGRINQVLYNLLTNALRYTPQNGIIRVTTRTEKVDGRDWVVISVEDTGSGIAEQDLPYIFNHFYRADKSRTRASGGSGIGLAIVKQLVDIHDGRVFVTSKLGEGTTFKIYLPAYTQDSSFL
ncbi:Adaptive-response sensory-kinase SasA [Sporomusa carbonis]|uniref:sensor histidine kinase n=1 Tax=Sporomusa carbonis TaxID=3076075 RepID=UPI003A744E08